MNGKSWYYAQLRWAQMCEEVGLTQWEEAVHIFLSDNYDTAFQQALEIGRQHEHAWIVEWLQVERRLAEIVELHEVGSDITHFDVRLESRKVKRKDRLPFDHTFNPEKSCPTNFF